MKNDCMNCKWCKLRLGIPICTCIYNWYNGGRVSNGFSCTYHEYERD